MAQQQHASDVRRRTALASHQPTNGGGSSSTAGGGATLGTTLSDASSSSVEYLDRVEEELNLKLDHDIQGLVQGLKDLVALARIDPLTSHPAQSHLRSVQQEARTQHMIKNAHSLLSISHQLKLLHLFGDVQHPLENRRTTERDLTNQIDHDKRTIESL